MGATKWTGKGPVHSPAAVTVHKKNSKNHNHTQNKQKQNQNPNNPKTHPTKTDKQNGKWSAVQSGD